MAQAARRSAASSRHCSRAALAKLCRRSWMRSPVIPAASQDRGPVVLDRRAMATAMSDRQRRTPAADADARGALLLAYRDSAMPAPERRAARRGRCVASRCGRACDQTPLVRSRSAHLAASASPLRQPVNINSRTMSAACCSGCAASACVSRASSSALKYLLRCPSWFRPMPLNWVALAHLPSDRQIEHLRQHGDDAVGSEGTSRVGELAMQPIDVAEPHVGNLGVLAEERQPCGS